MPERKIFYRLGVVLLVRGHLFERRQRNSLGKHGADHWPKERRVWIAINA